MSISQLVSCLVGQEEKEEEKKKRISRRPFFVFLNLTMASQIDQKGTAIVFIDEVRIFNDDDFDVSVFFFWGLWIGEKSLVLEQVFVSVKTRIQ